MPLIFQFDSDPTSFDSTPVEVEIKLKSYATKLWEDDAKLYKQRECSSSSFNEETNKSYIKKWLRDFSSSLG